MDNNCDLIFIFPKANDPAPKDVVPANNGTSAILRPETGPSVVTMMAPEVKDTSNGLYIPQEPVPQSQAISLTVEAPAILGPIQIGPDTQTPQAGGLMTTSGQSNMMPVEYNDMADFNTLATVAAAQTISMPVRVRELTGPSS